MGYFPPIESRLRRMGYLTIAGVDEAGRGPLAGPVVSAAVILDPKKDAKMLDDSKKLTAKSRKELFSHILENCLDYAITAIPHTEIDKSNILNCVREANKICIKSLSKRPDLILIDGRDRQFVEGDFYNLIKGERKSASIAAASILAKVTRDAIMRKFGEEFPMYKFERHMGYGTRLHRTLIDEHGLCEIHRKSYTCSAPKARPSS